MKKKETIQVQVLDTAIPDTTDIERRVLADICMSPEMFGEIMPVIHPDMFSTDERRTIWQTMVDLYNDGKSLDMGSVIHAVGMDNFKAEVTPMIGADAGGVQATQDHAFLLRAGAARRRTYFAIATLLQNIVIPTTTEQEIMEYMEAFNREVEGMAPLQDEKKLSEVLKEVKEDIDRTAQAVREGKTRRITTGYRYMNYALNGGFKSGQLIIIAARPSVGKTALMLQMARAAAQAGHPVQIFSLEMQADELAERMIFSTGEVRPMEITQGVVSDARYEKAEMQLAPLPLYINDFSRSLDDIVSRLSQAVKQGRCSIAYIDYLGLISDALNFGNAKLYQVIARITGTMKAVAKRLGIPIILLCQMNREAAREGRSPELFDLRDSGSIEQDADVVLMLENKISSEKKLVAWLRKNRSGKKEYGFVFRPNDTYSAFDEETPLAPQGMEMVPLTVVEEEDEDDDMPFGI